MFGFQRYIRLLPRLILNPRRLQQNLSLGINPVDNTEPCCPHDNIVGSKFCDECMKFNLAKRLSLARVHFVTALASLLTDHINVWSTDACQVQACQDNLWAHFRLFSNWFKLFLFELVIIQAGTWNFVELLHFFVYQHAVSLSAFSSMSFHVVGPRDTLVIYQLLQQKYVIQTSLYIPQW